MKRWQQPLNEQVYELALPTAQSTRYRLIHVYLMVLAYLGDDQPLPSKGTQATNIPPHWQPLHIVPIVFLLGSCKSIITSTDGLSHLVPAWFSINSQGPQ